MQNLSEILKTPQLIISELIVKNMPKDLPLNDFLVFLELINKNMEFFDCSKIAADLGLKDEEVMTSFNNLILKEIIQYKTVKENNRIKEVISLDKFYNQIVAKIKEQNQEKVTNNIFDIFQRELVRSLSPIEYEYINNWLEKGLSEELIIGALKEAIISGAKNFRYIDRILFDWQKKGYQSMNDVASSRKLPSQVGTEVSETSSNQEYFDYDWLNDDEE